MTINIKKYLPYSFEDESGVFKIYEDSDTPGAVIMKMEVPSLYKNLVKIVTKSGLLYMNPVETSIVYNGMVHYSFYEKFLNPISGAKSVLFYADKIFFKVPLEKMKEESTYSSDVGGLSKKIYIPRVNLIKYAKIKDIK